MLITKMQSVGNDYIIVDGFSNACDNASRLAFDICNRHFGIGADGLIVILYSNDADFKIDKYDSEGERCSLSPNLVMCAVRYAIDNNINNVCDKKTISIDTDEGIKYISVDDEYITYNAGHTIFTPQLIPVDYSDDLYFDKSLSVGGEEYIISAVGTGNEAFAVAFVDNGDLLNDIDINKIAPFIETNRAFPNGTNVVFANIVDDKTMQVRCWKKTIGEYIGFDYGAVAAFSVANYKNNVGDSACIELVGGDLMIEISDDDFIYVKSKPKKVFEVEWNL